MKHMENGLWEYTEEKDGIHIRRFLGDGYEAEVPSVLDGTPVRVLEKKAFLSKKRLRRIVLPESVTEVGDWAFAYCGRLKEVVLNTCGVRFGKDVFLDCKELERISGVSQTDGTGELLAAAVLHLDAYYLLEPAEAGSISWIDKWDARLKAVLAEQDSAGFSRLLLCGEEDYAGKDNDYDVYIMRRRKKKVCLCYLRLRHSFALKEELKRTLQAYLRMYARNGSEAGESFRVLMSEYGSDPVCFRIFTDAGCVTEENAELFLRDMERLDVGQCTQLKAWLLQYKRETFGYSDIRSALSLDF